MSFALTNGEHHADDHTYNVAADELLRLIEQYEQMEAEKKDVTERQKEIMAEAKARGYDTKVMKKVIALRKRDRDDIAEEEAIPTCTKPRSAWFEGRGGPALRSSIDPAASTASCRATRSAQSRRHAQIGSDSGNGFGERGVTAGMSGCRPPLSGADCVIGRSVRSMIVARDPRSASARTAPRK